MMWKLWGCHKDLEKTKDFLQGSGIQVQIARPERLERSRRRRNNPSKCSLYDQECLAGFLLQEKSAKNFKYTDRKEVPKFAC